MNPVQGVNPNDVIVATAIIAIIEFLKKYVPQINGGMTILVAAILGGLAGLFQINGLNVASGIMVGLASSGVHQVATAAGGK